MNSAPFSRPFPLAVRLALTAICIAALAPQTAAKVRANKPRLFGPADLGAAPPVGVGQRGQTQASRARALRTQAFEDALRPFFEFKASNAALTGDAAAHLYSPSDGDIFLLARHWNQLSEPFKALYKKANAIPSDYLMYVSPGGHFEIYYTLNGPAAVDQSDQYGYGDGDNYWRQKRFLPNGAPDYVDEVAWAFDSAWSMEIDRFGFQKPFPYKKGIHSSDRYKVLITQMRDDFYGMSWPVDAIYNDKEAPGYSSYIEIRNHWRGWNQNEIMDYEDHPEKGIRITAVHEFFHAIQYAMTWRVENTTNLDLFPVGWLEGTAVLMEELGFDEINDYLQYMSHFFNYPTSPVFLDNYVYKNSAITKYLYERGAFEPGIRFMKSVHDLNFAAPHSFHDLLTHASAQVGRQWADLLNSFFAESFFTGNRANERYFVIDAPLQPEWSYGIDDPDTANAVTKSISPYAMQTFAVTSASRPCDSLHIQFVGDRKQAAGDWAASLILTSDYDIPDTLIPLPVTKGRIARTVIPDWSGYDHAIVIVTNAHPSQYRSATVYFSSGEIESYYTDTLSIFPNPVSLSNHQKMVVEGEDFLEARLYSIAGEAIALAHFDRSFDNRTFTRSKRGFAWMLKNAGGKKILPGTYVFVLGYKDRQTKGLAYTRKKIMVIP